MALQYLRKTRATFNGGFIVNPGNSTKDQLRIEFTISKGISSAANTADITIYNLNESHRNSIGKEFDSITLEAGYIPPAGFSGPGILDFTQNQNGIFVMGNGAVATGPEGNVGVIFKGAVRDVEHRREGPNIMTIISCGDGDRALRRATISKSFPAGTPVKDVVEEIYSQMEKEGVTRGEWRFPEDMAPTFKRPYAACGSCAREMDTIGRGKNLYWSLQNETMEIVPGNGFVGSVALVTPETGMIGTPSITDNGVRVSALLNPEIRPNRRVQVKSQTLEMNAMDGMYRVSEVTFSGNNMDGEFKVDVTGESIQGGKVDEGVKR